MLTRRQYIEYKLKYIQKISADPNESSEGARSEALASKSTLLSELSALQGTIEVSIRDYEQQFGEKFVRPNLTSANISPPVSSPEVPTRPLRSAPHIHERESPIVK